MIKIFTGWSNSGGSTTALINLCNLFNDNGYECIMYGPHTWHLDRCRGANLQTATTTKSDKIIYHFLDVRKTRPDVDKFVLTLHEKALYPLKQKPFHIFDKVHFLNKEQINWHGVYKDISWFICGNAHESLIPLKQLKQRVAGIIGNIDENKQVHTSIQRALKDGHKDIRIYGNNNDPKYWDNYVQPLLNKNSNVVKFIGYENDKQKVYNTVTDVYHSSLSENASLVYDECRLTDVTFHGNENIVNQPIWSNLAILKLWVQQFEL